MLQHCARGTCPEFTFPVEKVRALAVKVYMLVYGRVGSAAQKHLPEDLNPKIREQLQVQSRSPAICQSQCRARAGCWPLVLGLPCFCMLPVSTARQLRSHELILLHYLSAPLLAPS